MQTVKIEAKARNEAGKGMARRLRSEGLVPAVLYGKGEETVSLAVSPKELIAGFEGELGRNAVFELALSGASKTAQVVDYQVHPVSRALLHVDFKVVTEDAPVVAKVPLEFVGKAKGTVLGGRLRKLFREIPVKCLPGIIPAKITYDVTELDVDDVLSVSDLKLPEGVVSTLAPALRIGGVYGAKRRGPDDKGEGEEESAS